MHIFEDLRYIDPGTRVVYSSEGEHQVGTEEGVDVLRGQGVLVISIHSPATVVTHTVES